MTATQIKQTLSILHRFARQPFEEIGNLPEWGLKQLMLAQLATAALSGVLAGLMGFGLWRILQGLVVFPVFAVILNLLLSCFLYYFFQIFERKTVSFLRLQVLVYFASLPFFLFHIAAYVFVISDLFGLAMTGMLLIIGLTENFQLEKNRSFRLIGLVFGLLLVFWVIEKMALFA